MSDDTKEGWTDDKARKERWALAARFQKEVGPSWKLRACYAQPEVIRAAEEREARERVHPGPKTRAAHYSTAFPDRPPLAATERWVTGTWQIGACYKNPNSLYGAYPHGYLARVHAMFPDAGRVLHVFSGGLDLVHARAQIPAPSPEIVLVDVHGPEQGRFPTWQGDLFDYCALLSTQGLHDLVLADPPYSAEDAKNYDTPMVNRGAVMRALRKVTRTGGNLVWLDTVWPMHRKTEWKCWGQIGLVRSTNHRVRLVSFFEAV